MKLSADGTTWTVSGTDLATGQNSTLRISAKRAGHCDYAWAMLVNENIGVNQQCDLMPASADVTFTGIKVNGAKPAWTPRANCAGDARCDCSNNASVSDAGDVILSWRSGSGNIE